MLTIKNVLHDKTKGFSRLEFDIMGKEINYVLVNTLRRMVLSKIPVYAYTEFTFNKNNSMGERYPVFLVNFFRPLDNLPQTYSKSS